VEHPQSAGAVSRAQLRAIENPRSQGGVTPGTKLKALSIKWFERFRFNVQRVGYKRY